MHLTRSKLLLAFVSALVAAAVARADEPTATSPIEAAWQNLASNDDARATRAILTLSKSPKEAVAFLKANLLAVKADRKRVARLIADLDSDQFAGREKAQQELEYLGKYIKDDLKKALENNPSPETKKRLEHLLEAVAPPEKPADMPAQPGRARSISVQNTNGQIKIIVDGVPLDLTPKVVVVNPRPMLTWVRAARAVAVLEDIGTPEARQVLDELARGEAGAKPTVEAKAALERLRQK
jgi:hypothetical protein